MIAGEIIPTIADNDKPDDQGDFASATELHEFIESSGLRVTPFWTFFRLYKGIGLGGQFDKINEFINTATKEDVLFLISEYQKFRKNAGQGYREDLILPDQSES